jgi:hypothetical protein
MAKKRVYKKVSCHNTKSAATKAAKNMRAAGKTAKVATKNKDGKYCVSSAGKRKK